MVPPGKDPEPSKARGKGPFQAKNPEGLLLHLCPALLFRGLTPGSIIAWVTAAVENSTNLNHRRWPSAIL